MNSRVKRVGGALFRVFLPFSAMKQTAVLARREVERSKENVEYIGELWKTVNENAKARADESVGSELGFEAAMANRREGALDIAELHRFLLTRKRWAIGVGALFLLTSGVGLVGGVSMGDAKTIGLSLASMVVSSSLFFVIALGAEHRIWQLRVRRLSRAEKGGIADFYRETPGFFLAVINPISRPRKSGSRHD